MLMDTKKRMQLIRMIAKMEKNPEFSRKIGAKNRSYLRQGEEKRSVII